MPRRKRPRDVHRRVWISPPFVPLFVTVVVPTKDQARGGANFQQAQRKARAARDLEESAQQRRTAPLRLSAPAVQSTRAASRCFRPPHHGTAATDRHNCHRLLWTGNTS